MKLNIWLLFAFSLAVGNVYASAPPAPDYQVLGHAYEAQFAQVNGTQKVEPELSAEEQAVLQRKEFVDRMIELRDRRSELDKQSVQLIQGKYELSSQLDQNELERKRVRIDQKAVSRNIKELEREQNIFEKRDKQRKKIERMQSGN